jgi:hypothetical protein
MRLDATGRGEDGRVEELENWRECGTVWGGSAVNGISDGQNTVYFTTRP